MRSRRHLDGYRECIKAWASGHPDTGKAGGGRMYFGDATLYSYGSHYPMARIVLGASGAQCALVNDDSNSATTNKHMSLVRGIVMDNFEHYFYVPTRAICLWGQHRDPLTAHAEAIEHYRYKAKQQFEKAVNPRTRKKDEYAARAIGYIEKANEYAKFFGLAAPFNLSNTPEAVMFAWSLGDDRALVEYLVKETT